MKLEIFKKKYVVMTGDVLGRRREIKNRTAKLMQLHAWTVMERSAADPQPVAEAVSDTRQVGEIVAECVGDYQSGKRFQQWHQHGAAAGDDRSAVDYGYACQIAAHTHDPALIEAVMRSGAMLRAKWDDRQHRGWLQDHCILPAIRATPLQERRSLRNGDGRLESETGDGHDKRFPFTRLMTSAELAASTARVRFLVSHVMAECQCMIIGGRKGTLKTIIGVDLAISLGSGENFLGKFPCVKSRTAFWSGESGTGKIREIRERIMASRGLHAGDDDCLWQTTDLPTLSDPRDLQALEDCIVENDIKVSMFDPTYMCLMSPEIAHNSSNLLFMGPLLRKLTAVGTRTGCTMILMHHFRKTGVLKDDEPAGVEELSASGLGEWARQYILLQRRGRYNGDGKHVLWMVTGGSAGHSGTYEIKIDEGDPAEVGAIDGENDDAASERRDRYTRNHRRSVWEVTVRPEGAARGQDHAAREAARLQREEEELNTDRTEIITALRANPMGMTKTQLRDEIGMKPARMIKAINSLTADHTVMTCRVRRYNTEYDGWKLTR
jgi:hypothetical protein